MIRSRVFITAAILSFFFIAIVYGIVDFREKEDKAHTYYQTGDYQKVLNLYKGELNIDSESVLLLLSQSISKLEIRLNESKTKESAKKFFKKNPQFKLIEWDMNRGIYLHIEDPYFPLLKKHSTNYKKALITKILSFQKLIPKDQATYFLLLLIVEDPRGQEIDYSRALGNLLRLSLNPFGEIENDFLLENLSYLVTYPSSLFHENLYEIKGTNINLRNGPGKENKEIGKVSYPDQAYCFEKGSTEENLANRSGYWFQCYFPHLNKSAWIFSGLFEKEPINERYLNKFEKRFKLLTGEIKIDFQGWTGEKIPPTFHGTYISRSRVVEAGEVGFPLFGNSAGDYRRICKKISGEKNYFEFSYLPPESSESILILELHLNYSGRGHLAFTVEADKESILINRNRYILDEERKRENVSLHIESRDGDRLVGSLWRRNTGLLQSIRSLPIEMSVFSSGKYSWEICLPLATKPKRDQILLFDIKTGIH